MDLLLSIIWKTVFIVLIFSFYFIVLSFTIYRLLLFYLVIRFCDSSFLYLAIFHYFFILFYCHTFLTSPAFSCHYNFNLFIVVGLKPNANFVHDQPGFHWDWKSENMNGRESDIFRRNNSSLIFVTWSLAREVRRWRRT